MEFVKIGKRLEECMRARGFTRKTFARELGISEKTLKSYLRGKTLPRLMRWGKIADILNSSLNYITLYTDEKPDYLAQYEEGEIVKVRING